MRLERRIGRNGERKNSEGEAFDIYYVYIYVMVGFFIT